MGSMGGGVVWGVGAAWDGRQAGLDSMRMGGVEQHWGGIAWGSMGVGG